MKNVKMIALICGAIFALGFPLVVHTSYYIHILFMVYLFAALGVGWNLIGGYGAQLSLGHSIFFAIGAYVPVLLMLNFHISPLIGGIAGIGLALLAAALIGLPCFRLRGPYFALATIAAGEITRTLLLHFQGVTGGANGLPIPVPTAALLHLIAEGKVAFDDVTRMTPGLTKEATKARKMQEAKKKAACANS